MDRSPDHRLLAHPLLAGLSCEALTFALAFFRARREEFPRGSLLKQADTSLPAFGIVESGRIQVRLTDMEGSEVLMAAVGPSDSFGESLAYLGVPSSPVYIVAEEDSAVWWFYPDALHRTDTSTPEAARLAERFTALLAERALAMNDRIQILSRPTIRERLVIFLSRRAQQAGSRTFRIPLDRAGLAAYLGVNRSALSRELSAMKREGLIDFFRGSFRLLR